MKAGKIISIILVVLAFLTAIYFYPQMPAKMASHWGINGEVNGYLEKDFAIFFMPVLLLLLLGLFIALPKIDPLKKNYKLFQKEYDMMIVLIIGFLYYIYLLTIAYNLGYIFNMAQFLAPAFAILFFFLGIIVEKAKQNWFVGIKTPWTLSSKKVWDKTHKIGGKLFKAAGIIALLGIAFPALGLGISIIAVLAIAIFLVVYSYVEFGKERKNRR